MSVLSQWNEAPREQAEAEIIACCGSRRWAAKVCAARPYADTDQIINAGAEVWRSLDEQDWMEAFACHPRIGEKIGETPAAKHVTARSAAWSSEEQKQYSDAEYEVKGAIADGNREYERQYGFIYIVCASGKTPAEMLAILRSRLGRDRAVELHEAALQQQHITKLRLGKWLGL